MNASPAPVVSTACDLDRRDGPHALMRRQQSAARAERHDDRLDPLLDEAVRGGRDLGFRFDRHAGEDGELGLVRHEVARLRNDSHVEVAAGRRRIQHCPDAILASEANCGISGFKLDLELQQDEIASLERLACSVDVR